MGLKDFFQSLEPDDELSAEDREAALAAAEQSFAASFEEGTGNTPAEAREQPEATAAATPAPAPKPAKPEPAAQTPAAPATKAPPTKAPATKAPAPATK